MHYDVAIIGSGPAGVTAGLALENSGLSVAVIDRSDFPRDKICGDAIGGRVKNVVRQLPDRLNNALQEFEWKNDSRGWKLFAPNGKTVEAEFVNHGYVARRIDFDYWLQQHLLRYHRVNFLSKHEIKNISKANDKIIIGDISASLLIGCDGAQSVVARQLGGYKVDYRHHSGAVRAYFNNIKEVKENMLEIHLVKDYLPGYFWIFPLKDNLFNVGFGMLSSDISERKINLKKAFIEIIQSASLRPRFIDAQRIGEVRGYGLPLGGKKRRISGERFMLCGDAASLVDPLTGEGIGNAMLSGLLAAKQAIRCFERNDFSAEQMKKYDQEVYKKLLPELRKNLLIQRIMNREWLINALVNVAVRNPKLKDRVAKYL